MPDPDPISSERRLNPSRRFNARLGIFLFVVYLALYLGFVLINAFNADLMESIVLAGLNLAIVYGFGLIVVALLLAILYGALCRSEPVAETKEGDPK
jgi:uncharacterized membrane protein (DUF485 family)